MLAWTGETTGPRRRRHSSAQLSRPFGAGRNNGDRTVRKSRRPAIGFWAKATIEELARLQGIKPVRKLEDIAGGWPEGQEDDGFEKVLAQWRQADMQNRGAR